MVGLVMGPPLRRPRGTPPALLFPFGLFLLVAGGCIDVGTPRPSMSLQLPVEEILLDVPYRNLAVELDYVEPYRPSKLALDELRVVLERHTVKHNVRILDPQPIPPQSGSYTSEDLDGIHREYSDVLEEGDTATLHVLYLNGRMKERDALGVKFAPDAIVLFPIYFDRQRIGPIQADYTGLAVDREETERAVLIHETGHLFGLVNCGIPMVAPHEDTHRPCHSSSNASVMYYAIDDAGDAGFGFPWTRELVHQFDADDVRDIESFIAERRAARA